MSYLPHARALCASTLLCLGLSACGDSIVLIQGDAPEGQDQTEDIATDQPLDVRTDAPQDEAPAPDATQDLPRDILVDLPQDQPPIQDETPDEPPVEDVPQDMPPLVPPSASVEAVVFQGCSTSLVRGLSQQLIDEMNCIQPGVMRSIAHIQEFDFYTVVFPYLQGAAATSVESLISGASRTRVSSALRTVPQQFLLYRWYQTGRCGIGLAARPGNSNHNGGKAIDTPDYNSVKSRFTSNNWRWLGSSDPVHYELIGGQDVRSVSVLALQKLWNRNHPNDLIAEDGDYGPQTESRLKQAPSMGFPVGAMCAPANGLVSPAYMSMVPDEDTQTMRVIAPHDVHWVEYELDGQLVARVGREDAVNFELPLSFEGQGTLRARAFSEEGHARGQLDASYVVWEGSQGLWFDEGAGLKTLRLERAPSWLGALRVRAGDQVLSPRHEPHAASPTRVTISTRGRRGVLHVDLLDRGGEVRQTHPLPALDD